MAYIAWPAVINQVILEDGYKNTPLPNILTSNVDAGPQVMRARYPRVPVRHTIQLRLNRSVLITGTGTAYDGRTEFEAFRFFVYTVLGYGLTHTAFPLPFDFAVKECRFIPQSGQPYTETKYAGDNIYVSFMLEEVLA